MNSPRALLIAGSAAVIAAAAIIALRRDNAPPVDPAGLHKGNCVVTTNPADVFSRALWRRPSAGDNILHAERREWTEGSADGPAHWQWFLDVEASPELLTWLKEKNPFSLRPADKVNPEAPPAWWPEDLSAWEIRSGGAGGGFTLLFSRNSHRLCATDSGSGFTPAAPVPGSASPQKPDTIPH